jgi:hypothetical protein
MPIHSTSGLYLPIDVDNDTATDFAVKQVGGHGNRFAPRDFVGDRRQLANVKIAGQTLPGSDALEQVHALLRQTVPAMHVDRYLAPDIESATELVRNASLARILRTLPELPKLWIAV